MIDLLLLKQWPSTGGREECSSEILVAGTRGENTRASKRYPPEALSENTQDRLRSAGEARGHVDMADPLYARAPGNPRVGNSEYPTNNVFGNASPSREGILPAFSRLGEGLRQMSSSGPGKYPGLVSKTLPCFSCRSVVGLSPACRVEDAARTRVPSPRLLT